MRFYVVPYRDTLPSNAKFPCVQLTCDSWNDFGYVTPFTMTYHATKKTTMEVGSVKILRRGESSPKLGSLFSEVPDDCCSLGQSPNYYKTLSKIPQDRRMGILRRLRDVVSDPSLAPLFESDGGWKTSILRFSEAEMALKEGRAALDANEVQEQPNPRERGKVKFKQIVSNISNIGLKKPITVVQRGTKDGKPLYELVCRQGRLEACRQLGDTTVPALNIGASREPGLMAILQTGKLTTLPQFLADHVDCRQPDARP